MKERTVIAVWATATALLFSLVAVFGWFQLRGERQKQPQAPQEPTFSGVIVFPSPSPCPTIQTQPKPAVVKSRAIAGKTVTSLAEVQVPPGSDLQTEINRAMADREKRPVKAVTPTDAEPITPSLVRQSRQSRGLALTYFPLESVEGMTLLPGRMAVLHDRALPEVDRPACGREPKGTSCAILRNGRVLIVMPCFGEDGKEELDCKTQMRKQLAGK